MLTFGYGLQRVSVMQMSKVIEFEGIFIGAAILLPEAQGWRFVSADWRSSSADGVIAATLHETALLGKRAFVVSRGRQPALT